MNKLLMAIPCLLMANFSLAQNLYDIDNITEIRLVFDDPNWDATMDTYYANDLDELLYGTCEINGVMYDSAGVTYKGNSTYNASNDKNPLKIKLAEIYSNQEHQGYKTLKLSNGDKDPSFVREVLSYEIGRKYMQMPLSNYAMVYINEVYYGLFVSSESINGDFMEDRFYSNDNNTRIKCNPQSVQDGSSLAYLGADSSLYFNNYELKSDLGWNDLVNICNYIENNPSTIESFLDVDRALWMLAFNNIMVNLDSYSGPFRQNYYLIMDDNGRLNPVIWDLNQSIGSFSMIDLPSGPPSPTTLADLTDMDPYLRENDTDFPLIYFLFANNRYRKMYMAHCRTILAQNITGGDYLTRAQELQTIIDAEVQSEPNGFYTHTQFTGNLTSQQGGGMGGGTYGLSEVMDGRSAYLNGHSDYNFTNPIISNIVNAPLVPAANSTVTFTADIQNANYAYLGYRSYKADAFQKVEMFDDGLHNDGAAADGIWGVEIVLGASDIQYYIYAENTDAGMFSPVEAEHEFYDLTLSGGVVINEIMASNVETAADEYGEYDDWIELYNNSASAVDLSGYFVSDDPLIPAKWMIPSGTSIAAGDYLIIWADNDDGTQLPLHTNFKLSGSGESVILSDATGMPISDITYPQVAGNGTYGRYPNGTGGFIPMYATYAAENGFTAVSINETQVEEVILYPNPTMDFFSLNMGDVSGEVVEVFTMNGQKVFSDFTQNFEAIEVFGWEKGTYIVSIPNLNWTSKIVVR